MRRPWTVREERRLEALVLRLVPYRQIAETMGRPLGSVASKAQQLHVRHGRFDVPPVKAWHSRLRAEDVRLSPSERRIWREQELRERA